MSLQYLHEDDDMALPAWAIAPKGKGVADHLKSKLLQKLEALKLDLTWWRKTKSKTWTSLVNGLIANSNAKTAQEIITSVIAEHRKRYSKQYSLD